MIRYCFYKDDATRATCVGHMSEGTGPPKIVERMEITLRTAFMWRTGAVHAMSPACPLGRKIGQFFSACAMSSFTMRDPRYAWTGRDRRSGSPARHCPRRQRGDWWNHWTGRSVKGGGDAPETLAVPAPIDRDRNATGVTVGGEPRP